MNLQSPLSDPTPCEFGTSPHTSTHFDLTRSDVNPGDYRPRSWPDLLSGPRKESGDLFTGQFLVSLVTTLLQGRVLHSPPGVRFHSIRPHYERGLSTRSGSCRVTGQGWIPRPNLWIISVCIWRKSGVSTKTGILNDISGFGMESPFRRTRARTLPLFGLRPWVPTSSAMWTNNHDQHPRGGDELWV